MEGPVNESESYGPGLGEEPGDGDRLDRPAMGGIVGRASGRRTGVGADSFFIEDVMGSSYSISIAANACG